MRRYLCALAMVLAVAGSARAATIQLTTEVNLSTCGAGGIFCSVFTTMPSQFVGLGDTIDQTVTFAANQRLVITDLTGANAFLTLALGAPTLPGAFTITNATATLNDLQGVLTKPLILGLQSGGDAHLGPTFGGFVPAGGTISFSGYRVQYQVMSLPAPFDLYSGSLLLAGGSQVSVVAPAAEVPEPATLSLLGWGLLGAGVGRMRIRTRRERRAS